MKREILRHEFVEFIPEQIEESTIYISIRFATASHLCCCGCGNKVVTPIRPTDWKLIFDGKNVSLDPSIGNWSFDCKSHYWIRNNRVRWAPSWSRAEIELGRSNDRFAKQEYFGTSGTAVADDLEHKVTRPESSKSEKTLWQAFKRWWRLHI
jgi:Family of unknown function (DUF6527)